MTFSKTLIRLFGAGVFLAAFCGQTLAAPLSDQVQVGGRLPVLASSSRSLGRLSQTAPMTVTLTLPLRRQAELSDLLRRLADPADPAYGRYLTPAQFAAQFSPTEADYAALAQYARAQGLAVTGTHSNRLLLDVAAPVPTLEAAFRVHLNRYLSPDGRVFHAPDAAPSVARAVAGLVTGVVGLSDAAVRRPHLIRADTDRPAFAEPKATGTGSGPLGGLAPQDIQAAYNLSSVSLTGSGQTMALFELDGYNPNDIGSYESRFNLPFVPMENILLDGATGQAGSNSDEVTLDIELQLALAPGVSRLLVYETGTADSQVLDGYSRIAEDNRAKEISTSWGLDEPDSNLSTLQSENAIFEQMAAQGQTIFAAAGDYGAYDTGSRAGGVTVDDPGSQPFVCSVGGTTLSTSGTNTYFSETTWNAGSISSGAGGGGISSVWPTPSWQQDAISSASLGSTAMRNVPDVSLNADPDTGYSVYIKGQWVVYGGTSCAAPLWAGFTALVNQQRAANGLSPLGQASPALYPLLSGAHYSADFHDIADRSTNLYYPAVAGYDDATGLGTLNGAALLKDLTATTAAASTHVLWIKSNGQASVWNYNASAGSDTQITYGPFAGWAAVAAADGSDGQTRILWDKSDGTASIWRLNAATGSYSQFSFGPYSGWTARGVSVDSGGTTHILWTNTSGQASVWNYSIATGSDTQISYGPFAGWTAKAIADGSDGKLRVLWDKSDGTASIWSLNNATGSYTQYSFGPYPGWTAAALSVGTDNTTHVLWNKADGSASVWNYHTADGTFSQNTYGPYSGWTAKAIADGSDGKLRVLWDKSDGTASIWSLNNATGSYTQYSFGPYPGWTAAALSAGE